MDERATSEVTIAAMAPPNEGMEIVERLATHRTLGVAPRPELEWLAAHGELRRYAAGELLAKHGDRPDTMIIMLSGHGAVYIDRGSGRRKFMEWQTGDVTGMLPFSRMATAVGEPVIDQATEALVVHRDWFPEMIRECPVVTATLVHVMVDRVRHFASTDWQDDKMMSLGRLSAGLSHELNNPASAASRSAKHLADALAQAEDAAIMLVALHLTDAQSACLDALRRRLALPDDASARSPIERADREDEIARWLERRRVDPQVAGTLADTRITLGELDELAETLGATALEPALEWLAAGQASRALATDVERAATRIYELVSAVKRFTYMDRPTIAEPSSIAQALADTATVLAAKARSKSAAVDVDVPSDLPLVRVYGGELNQVWSNLIENALDAVGESGHVMVSARADGANVVVRVVDDGSGIPADITSRIFDPFFTTKPVGQGTGLGLDIARRIVRRHDGQIEFDSKPGRTEFRVILPAAPETVPSSPEKA
jgi:signal transduction histidine kinase